MKKSTAYFACLAAFITAGVIQTAAAQMETRYSGARTLTCYQGGNVIQRWSPVYRLEESVTENRTLYEFRVNGFGGPKEEFSVTGNEIACLVTDAEQAGRGQSRVLPGQHLIHCMENGTEILPQRAVHGLTITDNGFERTYEFFVIDQATPKQSVTIPADRGRCMVEPIYGGQFTTNR